MGGRICKFITVVNNMSGKKVVSSLKEKKKVAFCVRGNGTILLSRENSVFSSPGN